MYKNGLRGINLQYDYLSNFDFFHPKSKLLTLKKESLKDFVEFIRLKVCLFVTGIGVSGYLLFNPPGLQAIWVALSCFFVGAAGYSFNMITDKEEDLINLKKINPLANSNTGLALVACFITAGAVFAFLLSPAAIVFYWVMVALDIAYSKFRMKKIFPMKNIFTGFGLTQVFFIGAANAPITLTTITYYVVVSLFIFITSLVSDLRDYEGDKATNIRTIPVVFGYAKGKMFAYFVLLLASAVILDMNLTRLYLLLLFSVPIIAYLYRNEPKTAHHYLLTSFIFLPLGTLLI
jgi:4-hydroxybenzoate polyprenyltransferase